MLRSVYSCCKHQSYTDLSADTHIALVLCLSETLTCEVTRSFMDLFTQTVFILSRFLSSHCVFWLSTFLHTFRTGYWVLIDEIFKWSCMFSTVFLCFLTYIEAVLEMRKASCPCWLPDKHRHRRNETRCLRASHSLFLLLFISVSPLPLQFLLH